jgi:membrane protein YfhO
MGRPTLGGGDTIVGLSMRRRIDPWLLLLAALVVLYNLPQLLSGSVQYDGLDVHYAAQRYLSDELHAGRLPFWTPFIFSGFPFLADLQVAAWYPPNWPFYLAGITPRSIGLELALHSLIACGGTYLLAKDILGANKPAALTAAMLYGFSGWFATHSQHVGMVETAAWLPWFVLLLERIRKRVTPRALTTAAVVGAAIALPGHFQLALYTFFFVGVSAGIESLVRKSWIEARRLALGIATAAIGGAALAAIMILPGFELVASSERSQLDALNVPDIGFFHPAALLTLVYANFYGLLSGHYTGPGDSTQHYFYSGILLLPLALFGLRNVRVLRFALSLGVPFLWYVLGPSGGLYRLMARLPGFSSVELPMHGWFLVALGLALLGGAGMAFVARRLGCRWSLLAIGVLFLDVLTVNQLLNPLAYARGRFDAVYAPGLAEFEQQVAAAQPPVERVDGPELAAVGYRNHALQSRVETTYGYNPLELSAYAEYIAAAQRNPRLVSGLAANYELVVGRLQRRGDALPLAYFAHAIVQGGPLESLDPAVSTLVDQPLVAQFDPSAAIQVEAQGFDWLTFRYRTATPNLVRVAIAYYPGWTATMRGAGLPLFRADRAFIGVLVPAGEGEVRMSYTPRLFWPGAALSALALLAALGGLAIRRRGAAASALPPGRDRRA